jgi:hypothetical protein
MEVSSDQAVAAAVVLATIQMIIIFRMLLSKCLSQSVETTTDNAGTVNPHIIVEKIVWNVLMVTTAVKIVSTADKIKIAAGDIRIEEEVTTTIRVAKTAQSALAATGLDTGPRIIFKMTAYRGERRQAMAMDLK